MAEEDAAGTLAKRALGDEVPEKKVIDPHKTYNAKLEKDLRANKLGEKPLMGNTGYVPPHRIRRKTCPLTFFAC